MTKVVNPSVKKILLLLGVIVLAILLLGSTYPKEPQFVATAQSLKPPPQKPYKPKPIVVRKVVHVQQETPQEAPQSVPEVKTPVTTDGLVGSVGYAIPFGNCVNQATNPAPGNPITWPVLFSTPRVGATVLFTWNHTGRVTGIYSNGDIEVGHENCNGCPTRYSPAMIRGYR